MNSNLDIPIQKKYKLKKNGRLKKNSRLKRRPPNKLFATRIIENRNKRLNVLERLNNTYNEIQESYKKKQYYKSDYYRFPIIDRITGEKHWVTLCRCCRKGKTKCICDL